MITELKQLITGKTFLAVCGIIAVLTILPLLTSSSYIMGLFFLVFLYIALAQSWNILGGYTGQVNLGHAAFFGLGALTTRYVWLAGLPLPLGILASVVVALVFALIIGIPAFRLKGGYFVIGMLALAEILRITVGNVLPGISALPVEYIVDYSIVPRYYSSLIVAAIAVVIMVILTRSKTGLGMMAVKEDEQAAEATGVNALKYKLTALGLSAMLTGLAGGIFAYYHVSYYPSYPFSPIWTFDAMFIAYIGGVGTIVGPIIGALFYVAFRELLSLVLPSSFHTFVFGALFIAVILLVPGGLVQIGDRLRRLLVRHHANNYKSSE